MTQTGVSQGDWYVVATDLLCHAVTCPEEH
jgi:hypothetical protein